MENIIIKVEGELKTVSRSDYVTAKTAQLVEFGYSSLTEEMVSEQLTKVLNGETLNAIGAFIKGDIHA